jgi:hypothetical protein
LPDGAPAALSVSAVLVPREITADENGEAR